MKTIFSAILVSVMSCLGTASIAASNTCEAQFPANVKISILDDTLLVMADSQKVSETLLPITGSFWSCISMEAFPDKKLVFLEWNEGSAGTSSIYSKVSLLAFSVDVAAIAQIESWTLIESLQGIDGTKFSVNRTFETKETNQGVDVTFSGIERVSVDPVE